LGSFLLNALKTHIYLLIFIKITCPVPAERTFYQHILLYMIWALI